MMRILKKTCLTLLVIIPIYGNSEHHEISKEEIELSEDVTKKEKRKNLIICEKRAKLAPTAYSAKRIKKTCFKEYGLKNK